MISPFEHLYHIENRAKNGEIFPMSFLYFIDIPYIIESINDIYIYEYSHL